MSFGIDEQREGAAGVVPVSTALIPIKSINTEGTETRRGSQTLSARKRERSENAKFRRKEHKDTKNTKIDTKQTENDR
jgi:hypothetical protein